MSITVEENSTLWIEQDKDARKSYKFDLTALLGAGDTLSSVTWTVPAGITVTGSVAGAEAAAWVSGGVASTWYSCMAKWVSAGGVEGNFVLRVFILQDAELESEMGSALFPNKFTAVRQLRRDNLLVAAQNHLGDVELNSDYLWGKLLAAESEVAHTLRVKLRPTAFFPTTPTQEEIDALAGMPWEEDPGYDYDPNLFVGDRWGYLKTSNSPLISVSKLSYSYPAPTQMNYDIPLEWLRIDKKYGEVRIVPSTSVSLALSGFLLQVIGVGRMIPQMMRLTYVAGLANAARDYPELVDVVKKVAVLKVLEDSYLPQSGSISADGLSQSMSVDMGKYEDSVDRILNGAKGSNGGLVAAIHGIRLGVM